MEIPGIASEMSDRELLARADEESDKLLTELKEKVKVEVTDTGTLRKKLAVTVPAEVIAGQLERNFSELRSDALVPGFRKGRAPLRLVQKRFGADVRESLKTSILGQSFFAAVENHKFDVLGEPLFNIDTAEGEKLMALDEALGHIKLPESGDFGYACEIEIKPTFELPELQGIEVKTPKISITAKHVKDELTRLRTIRGRYEPLVKGKAKQDDQIIAKLRLSVDDVVVKEDDNVELFVRPTRHYGILLDKLDEVLGGAGPGEQRAAECTIPDDYERTDLRGKPGRLELTIHEIKRLKPAPVGTLLEHFGAESEEELREIIRDELETERDHLIERAKKEQVLDYLLKQIPLELPEHFSARQTERAALRKVIDLQQHGVPQSAIAAHLDELRTSAQGEVARNLKLEFILEKVAEQLAVEVTNEEVNTEIAHIARLYGQRFDRVRDSLHARGLLEQLTEQIRQDKCVALLLGQAQIVEVTEKPSEEPAQPDAEK